MKKNLIALLTLVCSSVMLFTSCTSSSKEDTSWQNIPKKLEGSAVEFKVNGEPSVGSVEFNPQNMNAAVVTLTNVISGYASVVVNTKLEKQADGSFNFSGEKEMTTPPVKGTEPAIVNIKVSGNVTDKNAKVTIITSGAGLAVGTYTGETLILKYSDVAAPGKTVIVDATSLTDVSIKLMDVIPGEDISVLSGLTMNNNVISGSAKTVQGTSVTVAGSLAKNVLTLELKDVKINDPQGWAGKYVVTDYVVEDYKYFESVLKNFTLSGAMYSKWINPEEGQDYVQIWSGLFRFIGGALLPQVLNNVQLEADGNVRADIINKPTITFDPNWLTYGIMMSQFPEASVIQACFPTSGWETSPKNLANWYEKDGRIYIKLNIAGIIAKELGNVDPEIMELIKGILSGGAPKVKAVIKEMLKINLDNISDKSINLLISYAATGFPMDFTQENGRTQIALDGELFGSLLEMRDTGDVDDWGDPIMTSDIQELWRVLVEANLIPAEAAMVGYLLPGMCGNWIGTTEFALGLEFK